jgi:antibiotic biosynthesis monooxygenase (ABM) superfamily enzyme
MNKKTQHKRAFLVWLAIYPLITLISYLFGDILIKIPLPLRTLVLTGVLVPLMVYLILPWYHRLFHKWLTKDEAG